MSNKKEENKKEEKPILCYHCNQPISETGVVEKRVKVMGAKTTRYLKRKFHLDCLNDYMKTMDDKDDREVENSDWFKVGDLFKEVLKIPKYGEQDQHAILRLLGLRVGKFVPKGNNVRGLRKGYSFECIYNTIIYSRNDLDHAIRTITFEDQKHKINYLMTIIVGNINFIDDKMRMAEKASKQLAKASVKDMIDTHTASYHKKTTDTSKVSSLLSDDNTDDDIFKGSEGDLDSLFI